MARGHRLIEVPYSVTFRPDQDGYGTVKCSWEEETREQRITLEAARKFAEGWKAEFVVKGDW